MAETMAFVRSCVALRHRGKIMAPDGTQHPSCRVPMGFPNPIAELASQRPDPILAQPSSNLVYACLRHAHILREWESPRHALPDAWDRTNA